MLDKSVMQKIRNIFDEISLPPRYLYARKKCDLAPVRVWLPPRPGRYERRRKKQLRRMGYSVHVWSPSAEDPPSSGFYSELAWTLYDGLLEVLSGVHAS